MIVFTDLDGTLIHRGKGLQEINLKSINRIRKRNIPLALVTGRNLFSLDRSGIDTDLFDYIIFSTGYGILNKRDKRILFNNNLQKTDITNIKEVLDISGFSYTIMKPGNDNHKFFVMNTDSNPEMLARISNYQGCEVQFTEVEKEASQFLVIFEYDREIIDQISKQLNQYSVVYSFSPLKSKYCWLEIFRKGVNKSQAALAVCEWENTDLMNCMAIGNDFNDYDLLKKAGMSFVVNDANTDLKDNFRIVSDSFNGGFGEAVDIWLKEFVDSK